MSALHQPVVLATWNLVSGQQDPFDQGRYLTCYYFKGKSIVLHLLNGAELRTHYREDREEKKAQHPVGFEPTTSP